MVRGADAERWVADRLQASGAVVLSANWQGGGGELDLVVSRGTTLRFVEVKARQDASLDPLESITPSKRRRLVGAARAWMRAHEDAYDDIAFVVAVVDLSADPWTVAWYDDAFDTD